MFEMLLALVILSMAMAVTSSAIRSPSPVMIARQSAASLTRDVSAARLRAINDLHPVILDLSDVSCDEDFDFATFFPDGTAFGPDLCIAIETTEIVLHLNPLTGRLERINQ